MEEDTAYPSDTDSLTAEFVRLTKFASGIFLCCCCIVGLYGNIMSIVIFSHSSMKSSINFLLASLSFIDAILLICVFFVLILPNFNIAYPTQTLTQFYPYIILILYPISTMTQTCSVWTFVLISIERYVAICHPLKRHKLMTMNEARLAQFVVVLGGLVYNAVRFWEYGLVPISAQEESNVNNTSTESDSEPFQLVTQLRRNAYYFLIYSTSLHLCTHFLLPFAIILSSHWSVCRSLERAGKQIRRVRRSGRTQRGTTFMIMTMTSAFVIFNILPLVGDLWEALDRNVHDGEWMKQALVVGELANCLSVLNSSCTFVIYLIYCKKYRRLFLKYLKCKSVPNGSPISQNESMSTAFV